MMKTLLPAAILAGALTAAPAAFAANTDTTAMEGTYLLVQPNESQRLLALNPGGSVSLVSQGQQVRGYTSGLGTWEMTGPDSARAAIIDFNDPARESDSNGASQIVYELNFSGENNGRFESVAGSFTGKAFAKGQNPLADDAKPSRRFANQFDGTRITVN
ncbi:MAG: hypothetical protein AAFY24_08165 [Pseudomonadota bacterium]